MAGKPSLQWYPGDWFKAEEVRACSPATRGIWFDFINYAFNSQSYGAVSGTIQTLARRCGATSEEMEIAINELSMTGAAEVAKDGNGFVTVVCRRLKREQEERDANAERVRKYREKNQDSDSDDDDSERSCNDDVIDKKRSSPSRTHGEDEDEVEEEIKKRGVPKKSWTKRDVTAIYELYPKRTGKSKALEKIEISLKEIQDRDGVDDPVKWLSERVKAFADSPKGKAGRYCPYPATWFHQMRYDDDPSVWEEEKDNRIGLMTYEEARAHWQKRGSPGTFPGKQYEKVDQNNSKPLWRYAA